MYNDKTIYLHFTLVLNRLKSLLIFLVFLIQKSLFTNIMYTNMEKFLAKFNSLSLYY